MKKLLLIAGIVLLSFNGQAQEKSQGLQGTWWVAGQVSYNSEKTGDAKSSSTMVLPIVGYFFAPSVTFGVGLGNISSTTDNAAGVTTADSNTLVVKPLIRKYWNINGGLYFYGQAALPVMLGKDKIADSKSTSVALEVAPGFDYIINKWLTVETSFTIFNLSSTTITPDTGEKTTKIGFNANPMNSVGDRTLSSLQVGVKFLF